MPRNGRPTSKRSVPRWQGSNGLLRLTLLRPRSRHLSAGDPRRRHPQWRCPLRSKPTQGRISFWLRAGSGTRPRTSPCSPKAREPCVGRSVLRGRSGDLMSARPPAPDRATAGCHFLANYRAGCARAHGTRRGFRFAGALRAVRACHPRSGKRWLCARARGHSELARIVGRHRIVRRPARCNHVAGALDRVCQDAMLRRKLAERCEKTRPALFGRGDRALLLSNFIKRSWHLVPVLCRTALRWCRHEFVLFYHSFTSC